MMIIMPRLKTNNIMVQKRNNTLHVSIPKHITETAKLRKGDVVVYDYEYTHSGVKVIFEKK